MSAYFRLQFRMFSRNIKGFGFPPILGYILIIAGFVGFSFLLFSKTEFAEYIYALVALAFVTKLSEPNRNDFLKSIFNKKNYSKLRLLENAICILPFLIFLVYQQSFIVAIVLSILALLIALIQFNSSLNFTIPLPINKKPFEFTVGFRKTYFVFPIAYFLAFMAIYVNNYNLGAFSIVLIGLVYLSYYSKPENDYFVWTFNLTPKKYIAKKVINGLAYFTLLVAPILVSLSLFFVNSLGITSLILIACYAYIITMILAKYSAYPHEMNVPQGILFAVSIIFPPALIGVIPLFYNQSIKRLNKILG